MDIPTFTEKGSVSFLQHGKPLPFEPRRMYYLHGIPPETNRGAHAHRALEQAIWAIHGRFRLRLDDGITQQEFIMDNPTRALYIPSGLWRDLYAFSDGAVCVVMASLPYDEADYIRDYDEFKAYVNERIEP